MNNHERLINQLSEEWNIKNNHKERVRYKTEGKHSIIPDLVDDSRFIEVEMTSNKDKYYGINDKEKILIIGIQSWGAFDKIQFYRIENPRMIGIIKGE